MYYKINNVVVPGSPKTLSPHRNCGDLLFASAASWVLSTIDDSWNWPQSGMYRYFKWVRHSFGRLTLLAEYGPFLEQTYFGVRLIDIDLVVIVIWTYLRLLYVGVVRRTKGSQMPIWVASGGERSTAVAVLTWRRLPLNHYPQSLNETLDCWMDLLSNTKHKRWIT